MESRYPLALTLLLFVSPAPLCAQDKPATIPSWEKLAAAYAYDGKAPSVKESIKEDPTHFVRHIVITGGKGESVPAIFRRPKADGVYPCVLLLHGLTSNKESMTSLAGRSLAELGLASLALDAPNHGERRAADAGAQGHDPVQIFQGMKAGILEYRTAMDYLKTRKDVDSTRIGLIGYSMGGMMGSILAGVDERVKAAVLCVGGDVIRAMGDRIPPAARVFAETVAPSNYVGHISPRAVLMINGKQDNIVNEAAAKAMHDAAKDPKEIIWADANHFLPPAVLTRGVDWLAARLAKKP